MTLTMQAAPAVIQADSLTRSLRVEQLTCAIGAEVGNVSLAAASRDARLAAEIRALLLAHKVLFFRDQQIGVACPPAGGDTMWVNMAPRATGRGRGR